MSFAPTPVEPVDITGLPVIGPGETVRGGEVLIVTTEPGRGQRFEQATTLRAGAEGALGAERQTVQMRGNTSLTVGTENGAFLPIGGLAVDASAAKRVIIDLNGVDTRSQPVFRRLIPSDLRSQLDERPNTYVVLSEGNDSFIGSRGADLVVLNGGNNTVSTGAGADVVVVNNPIRRSTVELGSGKDTVILQEFALSQGGRLTITDFTRGEDSVKLETSSSNVNGFGTATLRISAGNGETFRLRSELDTFNRGSVEFI